MMQTILPWWRWRHRAQTTVPFHLQDAELEAQRSRGADMDTMLAEKEKKLAERDAYIRDLQVACASSDAANEIFLPNEELKVCEQLTCKISTEFSRNQQILMYYVISRSLKHS